MTKTVSTPGSLNTQTRILVVDDEAMIHDALRAVLDDFDIRSAADAAGALREFDRADELDVALVDKNLPDRTGLELIRELKRRRPEIEIILITGYPSIESAIEAVEAGAFDYIPKPFNLTDLAIKVRNAADKTRMRRQEVRLLAELAESDERHRELFEASSDSIFLIDAETRDIRAANSAAAELYGYEREELVTLNQSAVVAVHGGESNRDRIADPQFQDGRLEAITRRDRKRDGTEFPVEVSAGSATLGGRRMVVEVVRDISERVRAEARTQQLQQQLAQGQRLDALGQLAGGIAHDFNNLLTIHLSYASILKEMLAMPTILDELDEAEFCVDQITQATHTATRLTRQLLSFSKQQLLAQKVLCLNDVVLETQKLLSRVIDANIRLETVLAPDLWRVKVDRSHVEQVLLNLTVNARDAMPAGGTITIETRNVQDDEHGRRAQLSVRDTGVGMSSELAEQIFDPFFTTKRPSKGTGLGLATVHSIAEQESGRVRLESAPGAGTTFFLEFPASSEAPEPATDSQPVASAGHGERILLVEDNDSVREATRRVLARAGYAVWDADTGEHAVAIAQNEQRQFDLLLTDIVLPAMSGRELVERIAAFLPRIRVLHMSAYGIDSIVERGLLREGLAFLAKPFTDERLLGAVRRALDADPAPVSSSEAPR